MSALALRRSRAFSMIELVIVVVIIGIIAAIAIPRLSRGSAGAADSAVAANLSVLRKAVELYQAEIGALPTAADIEDQLTLYSNDQGATSATKTGAFIFGPYIRSIPPLPVGQNKGATGIAGAAGTGVGWIYNETTGTIKPNTGTLTDARGVKYEDY